MDSSQPTDNNEKPKVPVISAPVVFQSPTHTDINLNEVKHEDAVDKVKLGIIALVTFVCSWLVLSYVVSFTEVNGISMNPTLRTGNILVVWKLPQTWAKITSSQYIPKRGQVVIVNDPNDLGSQYVKRVIGLPDESISISRGVVSVYDANDSVPIHPDEAPYGNILQSTQGDFSGQVGDGQIFVMGDNRAAGASIDSRSGLGDIPSNDVIGQVLIRIYPLDKIKLF